jgi:hypothetical protein
MFQIKVVEKIKDTFYVRNILPEKRAVYEIMETYGSHRQATGDSLLRHRKDAGFLTVSYGREGTDTHNS